MLSLSKKIIAKACLLRKSIHHINCYRALSVTAKKCQITDDSSAALKPKEIRIDVPWGHLAGKWWGPQNVRPILALHGWQDNAGSFDKLIPLLPQHIGYLALDLPGHGLSSRLPNGLYYSSVHGLHVLNLVKHHYKWKQLSLCGHSMGSILSFMYASIFPDSCDLFIGLDVLKPHQSSVERRIKQFRKLGDKFLITDERNQRQSEPPAYTYAEIVARWVKGTNSSVTPETAPILMQRAISPSKSDPNKFFFTRDSRLKFSDSGYISQEVCLALAKEITAPHLFVKATKSPYYEEKKYFDETIEVLEKSNPRFEWVWVDGAHHFHLTEPTVISPKLSEFILKYRPMMILSEF